MTGSFAAIDYLTPILSIIVTAILLRVLIDIAPRLGLMDKPGGHKIHAQATPVVGGLAMFCAFFLSVLVLKTPLAGYRPLFAGIALLVIVGVLDDMHELSSKFRFVPQIAAAMMMTIWGGVVLSDFGNLLGDNPISLGLLAIPVTIFAAVGVTNALNMSDGTDGQAASITSVVLFSIIVLLFSHGNSNVLNIVLVLVGVVVTFLVFNLRLGRFSQGVFMGDAGSMFLGFVICWLFVSLSQGEERVFRPVATLWIFALPLIDTVSVMIRRVLTGRSPIDPDRTHYHHILRLMGLSERNSLLAIVGCAFLFATIGLIGEFRVVKEYVMFYSFMSLFVTYFVISSVLLKWLVTQEEKKNPAERGFSRT